jgi:hypothetical protein
MHLKILRSFGDISDFREKIFFLRPGRKLQFFHKKINISENTQNFEMHARDTFFGKNIWNNIASYHHGHPSRFFMRIQGLKFFPAFGRFRIGSGRSG